MPQEVLYRAVGCALAPRKASSATIACVSASKLRPVASRPSVSTAARVKPGVLRSIRTRTRLVEVGVLAGGAYLAMTLPLVHYRVAGLSRSPEGRTVIGHRVIGKISRLEMAQRFLEPASEDLLQALLSQGKITAEQAELARTVPMADDITVNLDYRTCVNDWIVEPCVSIMASGKVGECFADLPVSNLRSWQAGPGERISGNSLIQFIYA